MKTRPTRIPPVTNQIPRMAPATVMGIETLQLMKPRPAILKFLVLLFSLFATSAVFGQTPGAIWTWTNNVQADMGLAVNWTNASARGAPGGNPSSPGTGTNGIPLPQAPGFTAADFGDTMLFDGQSQGPVFAISNTGNQTGSSAGGTTLGIYIHVTANQTQPVWLYTTVNGAASSGVRFNDVMIDAGAGTFNFGNAATTNAFDTVWGTTNPELQGLTNNSANTAIIWPELRWRYGAGGAHIIDFAGTGNWGITNDLLNSNGGGTVIQKDGPGTMGWTAGHTAFTANSGAVGTPFNINGGTVILNSANLIINITINNNGNLLEWNLAGQSQSYTAPINGTGAMQVNAGTLTLSGASTYTGNTILSGGELIANRAENLGGNGPLGENNFISFTGGTLGFSVNNSYDYSPRFTNTASQAFSFDTGGQLVTFTNALASTGGTLTKLGAGTLTLAGANTYNGTTTVGAGKLVIQGTQGNGAITVSNSAALGAYQGGQQITPTSLTLGTSSGATLEFNNLTIAGAGGTPAIAAGAISAAGPVTVNINSGTFVIGQSNALMSWTSGTTPTFALGAVIGASGSLSVSGNTLFFTVAGVPAAWTGATDANWDALPGHNNWQISGSPVQWINTDLALLDDTVPTANTNIILTAIVTPVSLTVNNTAKPYSITSDMNDYVSGSGGLTKNGNGTLALNGGFNNNTAPPPSTLAPSS